MTLVDTSLWIDHLRRGHAGLAAVLERGEVESHPFVIGEIACGHLKQRDELISLLNALPQVVQAEHGEVLHLLHARRLHGCGLGWVDLHLLTSTVLSGTKLWTRDLRLAEQARRLGVLFEQGSSSA